MSQHTKILIIGSGPAGYTAAIYAARANLSPLLVAGYQSGGQLMITTDVENYPGFADVIQGPWLMEQMRKQAEHVGTKILDTLVNHVDFSKRPFTATTDLGSTITADAVIVSTGAQAKWLNIPSEEMFRGFGVSACATCDGFFFRGKNVAVIGGGNTAVEEALYLTNHASHVTLIHRRDSLRAEKILQERLLKHPKISILWNYTVDEIIGTDKPKTVTHIRLNHTQDQSQKTIPIDGVFVAIGHIPSTELFRDKLNCDENGYLLVKAGRTHTNIDGVFAAGDVSDHIYRQAVTAAGMGCMAALDAERYIASL